MRQDGLKTPDDNAVALLVRQHMLWEMERDVFFLSPAFAAGYDFQGARSGRPSSEVELHKIIMGTATRADNSGRRRASSSPTTTGGKSGWRERGYGLRSVWEVASGGFNKQG
jgi:hypothetical protein